MMRTSLYLPKPLYQQLEFTAKRRKTSVSQVARELLQKALAANKEKNLDQLYQAWDDVKGIGKDPITDTSTTIDEILYGENGAWRGSER
jgi:hypothetical protein